MLEDANINSKGEVIHSVMMVDSELVSIIEDLKKKVCVIATKEELEPIERNKTWELVVLPQNKKVISERCTFKIKMNLDGLVAKCKARLVARGFP